ncbi:unnamed protein product [Trichobilharzia szidati]|nr:unnamed protein product [Trichobilharzia szidati]
MNGKDKENLFKLIKRNKDLHTDEEKSHLRKRIEGQLLKFTNVVKGYQYRWFVIDPDVGRIEYYEKEDHKRSLKPRGTLNLMYASVCPSDEDSQTFIINAANGDLLKLKAVDAKERQHWVDRLRAVAEYHTDKAEQNPLVATLSPTSDFGNHADPSGTSPHTLNSPKTISPQTNDVNSSGDQCTDVDSPNISVTDTFPVFCPGRPSDPRTQLGELFRQLEHENQALATVVDATSIRSPEITEVFKNLLLSKATSQATLTCLKRCMELIKRQDIANGIENGKMTTRSLNSSSAERSGSGDFCSSVVEVSESCKPDYKNTTTAATESISSVNSTLTDDVQDVLAKYPLPIKNMQVGCIDIPKDEDEKEEKIQDDTSHRYDVHKENDDSLKLDNEEQKAVILHLLSQLKIGMDLTKVALPVFILEKYSLLEMFANYMAHPNLFCSITDYEDPEARMLAFVQWYLTTFHAGKKDRIAKKPYNPIIGETFHCSWLIPAGDNLNNGCSLLEPYKDKCKTSHSNNSPIIIRYCAEQVSHQPPVTALHFSCPSKKMELTASICTKSKFQGMSAYTAILGKLTLKLGEHNNEEYHFSLPTIYARSILTVPWVEFGDKVSITCPQTNYSATVTFLTKPHYGDKLHRISGEIYEVSNFSQTGSDRSSKRSGSPVSPLGNVNLIARVSGEWNKTIDFEVFSKNSYKCSVDVNKLPVFQKRIRPIECQQPEESRRLWQNVTNALELGKFDLALEKKRELEEQQRISEKYRTLYKFGFPVKYFTWDESAWVFRW